jgi:hypothetical protein
MPEKHPTRLPAPAPFTKWRHRQSGTIYQVLDDDAPGKPVPGEPWYEGVLYEQDQKTLGERNRIFWRSREAFYADMERIS